MPFGGARWDESRPEWMTIPPRRVVPGIRANQHYTPFARMKNGEQLTELQVLARQSEGPPGPIEVCTLATDYASFSARTGRPPPEKLGSGGGIQGLSPALAHLWLRVFGPIDPSPPVNQRAAVYAVDARTLSRHRGQRLLTATISRRGMCLV